MSVIGNYLNGMSQIRGIQNHGSVEDLIRSTLGNRFIDSQVKKESMDPNQTGPIHEMSVNEFLSATQNIPQEKDQFRQERKLTPFQKSLLTSRESEFITPKKPESQEQIGNHHEEYFNEPEYAEHGDLDIDTITVKRGKEYLFHRDAEEIFECKVTVEGGSSNNTIARLILKTDSWNVFFEGSVKKNGTCSIPLKKLSLFHDGTTGHASLEIAVDDVVFVPWESPFRITMSKKVSIQTPSLNRR
jgi:hypothetical protein